MTTRPDLVFAREPIPAAGHPSVFLAGPTPRAGDDIESWRIAAIREITAQWGDSPITILTPESRSGVRAAHYDDQVSWETTARAAATAILFWIPRDLKTLPGFTTNVEFGLDITTGRVVLGCPPECPNPERNRYLVWVARCHGAPVRETLPATVAAALDIARRTARLAAEPDVADLARAYLLTAGWTEQLPGGPGGTLWHHGTTAVGVPHEMLQDSFEWNGVITRIAAHERRDPAGVAADILQPATLACSPSYAEGETA